MQSKQQPLLKADGQGRVVMEDEFDVAGAHAALGMNVHETNCYNLLLNERDDHLQAAATVHYAALKQHLVRRLQLVSAAGMMPIGY